MVTDYAGHEIKAGQTIVYPVRRGSAMWLSEINVTQVIGGLSPVVVGFNSKGRRINVQNLANVVVIEKAKQAVA